MFIKINPREKQTTQIVSLRPEKSVSSSDEVLSEAEIRRQMYERIARGNALAEIEENARREWRGR